MELNKISFIDLFGGVGGFRLGLEKANKGMGRLQQSVAKRRNRGNSENKSRMSNDRRPHFICVWYNDIDKYATQVYNNNFNENWQPTDIREVESESIPPHDLICAGFPCQSFSTVGKRRGFEDTRGTLFYEICRVARLHRPRFLLLENVRGLLSHDNGRTFGTILDSLQELGYFVEWEMLNSKNFGVPQNRRRVFIVGHLGKEPRQKVFPLGCRGEETDKQRKGVPQQITSTILSQESKLPRGITMIRQNNVTRRLTPLECERLQGFSDNWTAETPDIQRYKQMGNAVTVDVVQTIGEKMLEVL